MTGKTSTRIDLEAAREILRREAQAVSSLAELLDENFVQAAEMIYDCTGSVVLSGVGKAGIIGQKISATLASTGTPSHFLHAAEAVHGDLGRLREGDIAVVLSHSGASEEIVRLIAQLKEMDIAMIGVTGNKESPLAQHSDVTVWLGRLEEVCPLGLAPSASTTCMLAVGDALALTVMQRRNFKTEDYARYHPGGDLGRKLVTVEQAAFFSPGDPLPQAKDDCTLAQALAQAKKFSPKRPGCVLVVGGDGRLGGLVTDGDLRRAMMEHGPEALEKTVAEIMTADPKVVHPDTLASEAVAIFHKYRIDEIPVVDHDSRPVGLIDVQDIVALKILQ